MKLLLIRSARLRKILGIALPFVAIPAVVLCFALLSSGDNYALA